MEWYHICCLIIVVFYDWQQTVISAGRNSDGVVDITVKLVSISLNKTWVYLTLFCKCGVVYGEMVMSEEERERRIISKQLKLRFIIQQYYHLSGCDVDCFFKLKVSTYICARAPRIINSNASFHSFIKQVACCGMHRMLVGGIFSQLAGSDWFYRYTLYIFYRWSDFIFHITTPNDHKRSETQQSKTCVLWDGIFTSNKLLLRSSLSSFRHFFVIQQKINNCMNNNS